MNKNKKSFAQRARQLVATYKRAKFDPIEKQELDAALAALAQEQEAYKQANGIGEYSPGNIQAQQMEGVQQFDGVSGTSIMGVNNNNPLSNALLNQLYTSDLLPSAQPLNDFRTSALTGRPMMSNTGLATAPVLSGNTSSAPVAAGDTTPANPPQTVMGSTQGILAPILSGVASGVGNLILSKTAKPQPLKSSYAPESISLARQRTALQRQANEAATIGRRGLGAAGNRGAYLAGASAVESGINKNLADAMTQSYLTEEQQNLALRQQERAYNKQVEQTNWQQALQADQDRRAYQSAALATIPAVGTDISRMQAQNALLESLGSQNYLMAPSTGSRVRDILLGRKLYGTVRE